MIVNDLGQMVSAGSLYGGNDRILFSTRVGDITIKDVVSVREDVSIQEAAQAMAKSRVSSIIIMDETNHPVGILTDRDLREKVVARGRAVKELVATIMSPTLIRADADDYCFDAVLKMIKHDAQHILVINDGVFQGVLTIEDFMGLQGDSPFSFARDIENQQTVEGIVQLSGELGSIVRFLIREGARAVVITRIISELKDRLVNKLLKLTQKHFGNPPVSYCWIAYGSEGRRERVFGSDFHSGLIYSEPASSDQKEAVQKYFTSVIGYILDTLRRCGFGGGQQKNLSNHSYYCQSLNTWKQYFSDWILTPTNKYVLKSLKFFDFRAVAGDETLTESLRGHINMLIKSQDEFLSRMAAMISRRRKPLSMFSVLRLRTNEALKKSVDIQSGGLEPLADAARILALSLAIPQSSTSDRIAAVRKKDPGVARQCDEMAEALELMLQLQIRHQDSCFGKGEAPDNIIETGHLTYSERHHLREAFQSIQRILDNIADHYRLRLIGV
jgi:CBS domain-containing protein